MLDPTKRLFPCRRLPGTAWEAHFHTYGSVFAATAIVATAMSMLWCVLWIPLLLAISFRGCWQLCCGNCRNETLEFLHLFEFHCGADCAVDVAQPMAPRWLPMVVVSLCAAGDLPTLRAILILALIASYTFKLSREVALSPTSLLRDLWNVGFIFLAYPDRRFRAAGGTAAVWIPNSTILQRRVHIAFQILPFASAVATSTLIAINLLGVSPLQALIDAALFLPVPWLALSAMQMKALCELRAATTNDDPDFENNWEKCAERISSSTLVIDGVPLADHLFLGHVVPWRDQAYHPLDVFSRFDLPCRTPALLHVSALIGHTYTNGPTGSFKSSVGIAGQGLQIIRGHNCLINDRHGLPVLGLDGEPLWEKSTSAPILVFDLKGDPAFKNTFEEECGKRGQKFRAFTMEAGKATSHFNPLTEIHGGKRPIIEACEITLNALDLFHGEFSYGPGYYSEQNRFMLLNTLSKISTPSSWEELHQALNDSLDRRKHKDVFELLGRIYALSHYPSLGPAPDGVDTIHMPTVFENNECVYFWLPALASAMSVGHVAKLAMFCFFNAAREWNNSGKAIKRSYIFSDESQVLTGPNITRIYQQASGAKVCFGYSNQSLSDLNSRDTPRMGETVWVNTAVKQTFGIPSPEDRERWIDVSGERIGYLRSYSSGTDGQGRGTSSTTSQEVLCARLNQNIINDVNNTKGGSLLLVSSDAGLTRYNAVPVQIFTPFPMTKAEYDRRENTLWPDAATPLPAGIGDEIVMINQWSPEEVEAAAQDKYAALEALFSAPNATSNPQRKSQNL